MFYVTFVALVLFDTSCICTASVIDETVLISEGRGVGLFSSLCGSPSSSHCHGDTVREMAVNVCFYQSRSVVV